MRRELDELLCQKYPSIFKDRHADMRSTAMCWGFSCGDGWFDLVDVLCAEIKSHAADTGFEFVATQIKEKYGTLHFYVQYSDEHVSGLIWMASALSGHICEECGQPGNRSGGGWIETRCPLHGTPDSEIAEADLEGQDSEQVFRLPPVQNSGWQHIARALELAIDNDIQHNDMPMICIDEVVEGESLSFRWHGGDKKGRAAAFFRLVEAYSERQRPAE